MNRRWGFTLIELVVALAVVAVLVAVAVPSYLDATRKGRRADAIAALAELQRAQEKYRGANASYATTLAALGWSGTATEQAYYSLTLSGVSANGYTLQADAVAGKSQASDTACTRFTVNHDGPVIGAGQAECWSP